MSCLAGTEVTAKSVAEAAAAGDPLAHAVWGEAMRWLGIGIASAANLLNPARVVMGGGLSRAGELMFETLRQAARQHALVEGLEIVPAALGDEANLLGAAVFGQLAHHSPA
jgi:glucokinase